MHRPCQLKMAIVMPCLQILGIPLRPVFGDFLQHHHTTHRKPLRLSPSYHHNHHHHFSQTYAQSSPFIPSRLHFHDLDHQYSSLVLILRSVFLSIIITLPLLSSL
ncbi:hypothetical protein V8C42DRAFT_23946 [Trichoderma barbatum]